jgi:2-polyprenyl-6-methoxyphenol hydroxylase-like FAD-dependent oxidoreductase
VDVKDTSAVAAALKAFEDRRRSHCASVTQQAYITGKMFHHMPKWLQPVRDFVFDHTSFLQKSQGDAMPAHIMKQLAKIESNALTP